jgi:hypothetical protein
MTSLTPSTSPDAKHSTTLLGFLAAKCGTLNYFSRSTSPTEAISDPNSNSGAEIDHSTTHDDEFMWSSDYFITKKMQ